MQPQREKLSLLQRIRPERMMVLGFFLLIAVGGLLLATPLATVSRRSIGLLNGFFTATSAVCVTGLVVVDTGTVFSIFGKTLIICLIQVGGLGFMVFATLVMVALGKRISLRNRVLMQEAMNSSKLSGLVRLTLYFTVLALLIELAGACVLATRFIPRFGVKTGIFYSLFHAISAFCNAGFDLFGNYKSLLDFQQDPAVLLTLATLIILGGIGFPVIFECLHLRRDLRKVSLHTKLVLTVTAFLLLTGTLYTLWLEWANPGTLGREGLGVWDKIVNAFFQSTTLRTAGYASFDQGQLTDASKLLDIIYMFIGASSASTGGGIKITTMSVVLLMVISVIRGYDDVNAFGKQIMRHTVRRALTVFMIALGIVILGTCVLAVIERGSGASLADLAFEITSAFGTVGLSSINTVTLSRLSHLVLMPIMFFGRVGPLTIAFALAYRMENVSKNRVHFPEEKIMIG